MINCLTAFETSNTKTQFSSKFPLVDAQILRTLSTILLIDVRWEEISDVIFSA